MINDSVQFGKEKEFKFDEIIADISLNSPYGSRKFDPKAVDCLVTLHDGSMYLISFDQDEPRQISPPNSQVNIESVPTHFGQFAAHPMMLYSITRKEIDHFDMRVCMRSKGSEAKRKNTPNKQIDQNLT